MGIDTNALIDVFNDDTTNLEDAVDGSASVANNTLSAFDTTDIILYTHSDDSPFIVMWLQMDSGGTPNVGAGVNLIGQIMNATDIPDTTDVNDSPIPTVAYPHIHLGRFPVKNITTEQFIPIEVYLPNTEVGTVWQFGIHNLTGPSIDAGWSLHARAKTGAPHA